MAFTYADIFQYKSFVFNKSKIEYSVVTLLKELCGKKTGSKIEKIVLNPADGSWTIPKSKAPPVPTPKKTFVEFKGVHTRFEDSDDEIVYTPNTVESSTFKVFEGRKRVNRISSDSAFYEEFVKYINDLGSGSQDKIMVNNADNFIRVAGVNLESYFELNKRYKLPFRNFSISRVF